MLLDSLEKRGCEKSFDWLADEVARTGRPDESDRGRVNEHDLRTVMDHDRVWREFDELLVTPLVLLHQGDPDGLTHAE